MGFYLKLANTNHTGILDVLLTETILVITQNPCMPKFSRFVQNLGLADSGTTTPGSNPVLRC